MSPALLLIIEASLCPAHLPAQGEPGLARIAAPAADEAMRLNVEGKQLYRQERWNEAREKYRAALAVDPDFFGAQLNIACSYARQRRYAEAADEAAKLIRQSFVPWSREVAEAADLGILQDQEVYSRVRAARTETAEEWGRRLQEGVFFVARTKPPILLTGQGVLALGLGQEIFAWLPRTGRYFQVTAEDGHVVAFALSADRRRIAYLLSGRMVREPSREASLRGLSVRVLELATMTLGAPMPVPVDVRRLRLGFAVAPELEVIDSSGSQSRFRAMEGKLELLSPTTALPSPSVTVTSKGVAPNARTVARHGCPFELAMQKDAAGTWRIVVSNRRGKPFLLDTRYGAGLDGLPFPAKPEASGQKAGDK